MSERCSDRSRAAGESLAATTTTATHFLLLEVRGAWPRDVGGGDALPEEARAAVAAWLATTPGRRRLLFVRRPGRSTRFRLAFVVRAEDTVAEARRIELGAYRGLTVETLERGGQPVGHELALVCGHGSRDACCALRGTAVFDALVDTLDDEQLWLSSHHGGHRFAANVLVLPSGLQLGRVEPDEAPRVVGDALAGHIVLDRYRGRTCYEPLVQAADHAVRSARGLAAVDDLLLDRVDGSRVVFRGRDGREHVATATTTDGPSVPASCGAAPEPQRAFDVRIA